ncbi:MAG: hypothetical protein QOC70_147 [Verrucomicrobiota bacterium]|jgi:hypothetical protein
MAYQYADYSERSQRLISAGQLLLESLDDQSIDRSIAIQDLESAAQAGTSSEAVLRFSAPAGGGAAQPAEPISPDDALSSVLLDLQGANILLSAGIALNEHVGKPNKSLLNSSLENAESSRAIVASDLKAFETMMFAPKAGVKSLDLEGARKAFRENADGVLKDIVDDANAVVTDVLKKLKDVDGKAVLAGIDKLGESFQVAAAVGKLIHRGIELLNMALEALAKLFGKEAFAKVKGNVEKIWEKFSSGEYTHDFLAWALDVKGTDTLITAALGQQNVDFTVIDNATNDLPGLSDKYKSKMKLLRSLLSAVAVAGSIIALLHVAAPWIPLVFAGIYAALIGAAVLVAMDYADSGHVLGWVRGVGQIAGSIKP